MRGGFIAGVLDMTTTELADELVGGVLSAGPDRLEAAGELGIPQVVSLGALDMVNFGPPETVPERFRDRHLYVHNPTVTLMRTTPEECAELGRRIAPKLNAAQGPTALFVPLRGRLADRRRGPGLPRSRPRTRRCSRALRETSRPSRRGARARTRTSTTRRSRSRWPTGCTSSTGHGRLDDPDRRRSQRLRAAGRRRAGRSSAAAPARALGQVRRGGRRRPDHHLQLGPLPHGRPRLARRADALRRRQRDRRGHGRARCCRSSRRRPVLAGVCGTDPFRLMQVFLRAAAGDRASPACRTSRPSA